MIDNEFQNKAQILVESYNAYISESFNNIEDKLIDKGQINENDLMKKLSFKFMRGWQTQVLEPIEKTPKEYIKEINDKEEILWLFDYFSKNSIDFNPEILMKKVYSLPDVLEELSKRLDAGIAGKDLSCPEEFDQDDNVQLNVISCSIVAFENLPEEKKSEAAGILLEFMNSFHPNNDFLFENVAKTLFNMGDEAHRKIVEAVNAADKITIKEEFLLNYLCDIEDSKKTDEIYYCLKNAFRKEGNKMLTGIFLGEYGDGRAIPVLRRYAMSNFGKVSDDEYYSIVAAIEKLGGIIDDLIPNRIPNMYQ